MIYVLAGMNRSGSTWMFNAVRLLLERTGAPDLMSGWVADREAVLAHGTPVLKVHTYDPTLLAGGPTTVLASHRDLRDVVASMTRKFAEAPTMEMARHIFEQYQLWLRHAAHDMRYETMIADPAAEVRRLAEAIGLGGAGVDYAGLAAEINALGGRLRPDKAVGYDRTSLLHEGHITDGRPGSWRGQLPADVVAGIEREFGEWMESQGYAREAAGV